MARFKLIVDILRPSLMQKERCLGGFFLYDYRKSEQFRGRPVLCLPCVQTPFSRGLTFFLAKIKAKTIMVRTSLLRVPDLTW